VTAALAIFDAGAWCEARQIPADVRQRFARWFTTDVAGKGLTLPCGAAYALWMNEGQP
jgi:hypothetical protein